MTQSITWHADPALHDYFYNQSMHHAVQTIEQFIGDAHHLHIFSEATIKKNRYPNGILIESPKMHTILLPHVLRDPGCGFLIFKIPGVKKQQLPELARTILNFGQRLEKTIPHISRDQINQALTHGVSQEANIGQETFNDRSFAADAAYLSSKLNLQRTIADLHQITNSLELKIQYQTDESDIWGFLHTGSRYLPELIQDLWFSETIDYCVQENLASLDDILQKRLHGIPDRSDLGYAYQQGVFAAMNFCLFKRYLLFNQLQEELAKSCMLEARLIHDRCHAGLFEKMSDNQSYWLQSRGVQILDHSSQFCLIAGQRESQSYLIQPTTPLSMYLGHGTSYQVDKSKDYVKLLGKAQAQASQQHFQKIWANTRLNRKYCLAYEYNGIMQQQYLAQFPLHSVALLPYVNYQGPYLRSV